MWSGKNLTGWMIAAIACLLVQSLGGCSRAEDGAEAKTQPDVGVGEYLLMPGHEGFEEANEILFNGGLEDPTGGQYSVVTVRIPEYVSGSLVEVKTHGWVLSDEVVLWNGQSYDEFDVIGKADLKADVIARFQGDAVYPIDVGSAYNPEIQFALGPNHALAACILHRLGLDQQGVAVSDLKSGINELQSSKVVRYCVVASRTVLMTKAVSLRVAGLTEEAYVAARSAAEYVVQSESAMKEKGAPTAGEQKDDWLHPVWIAPQWPEYFRVEHEQQHVTLPSQEELSKLSGQSRIALLLDSLSLSKHRYPSEQNIEELIVDEGLEAIPYLIKAIREDKRWARKVLHDELKSDGKIRFLTNASVAASLMEQIVKVDIVSDTNNITSSASFEAFWKKYKADTLEDVWLNIIADPGAGQSLDQQASVQVGRMIATPVSSSQGTGNLYYSYQLSPNVDPNLKAKIVSSLEKRLGALLDNARRSKTPHSQLQSATKIAEELLQLDAGRGWPQIRRVFKAYLQTPIGERVMYEPVPEVVEVGRLACALISHGDTEVVKQYIDFVKRVPLNPQTFEWLELYSPLWVFPKLTILQDALLPEFGNKGSLLYIGNITAESGSLSSTRLLLFPEFRDAVLIALEDTRPAKTTLYNFREDAPTVADLILRSFSSRLNPPSQITDAEKRKKWSKDRLAEILSDDATFIDHYLGGKGFGLTGSVDYADIEAQNWLHDPLNYSHVRKVIHD